jgi:hypothetical protein
VLELVAGQGVSETQRHLLEVVGKHSGDQVGKMLTDSPEEFIAGRVGDGLDVEVGELLMELPRSNSQTGLAGVPQQNRPHYRLGVKAVSLAGSAHVPHRHKTPADGVFSIGCQKLPREVYRAATGTLIKDAKPVGRTLGVMWRQFGFLLLVRYVIVVAKEYIAPVSGVGFLAGLLVRYVIVVAKEYIAPVSGVGFLAGLLVRYDPGSAIVENEEKKVRYPDQACDQ